MISDSPSGMSNGILLVAAMPAVTKRTKASGWVRMPQAGSHPQRSCPCPRTISIKLSEPWIMMTPMIEAPIAISAELIRAAARWPPRSAKLLADDQPAIHTEREHREDMEDADVQRHGLEGDRAARHLEGVAERDRGDRCEGEEDRHERRQLEEQTVGARGAEVFLGQHLQRVGQGMEQAQGTDTEDGRPVGADAVLHDRRLLTLDPAEEGGHVQDEEHHERHAPERDAEVRHHRRARAATLPPTRRPVSPSAW